MLELRGRAFRNCDRVTRRSVLRVGALALGGVSLVDVLRRRAEAAGAGTAKPSQTAVIQLFLGGGPSQLDTFDLKPEAPVDPRRVPRDFDRGAGHPYLRTFAKLGRRDGSVQRRAFGDAR